MSLIRADLYMHGPIGFQPFWLRRQGYAGKNLLQLIADQAFQKGITIIALTSQADEIPPGSVQDRFGCLRDYEAPLLPKEYKFGTLGGKNNILVVEKDKNRLFIANGQTVMPSEGGQRFDLLVIGSNQVPNGLSFRDTLQYGIDNKLIQVAEHPFIESHRGMGRERLERHIDKFDAIEGFNAQAVFPDLFTRIPLLGKGFFSRAGRELNEKSKAIAREYGKPYIATSDAHRIKDLGISYIEWTGSINDASEEKLLGSLKTRVVGGSFSTVEHYLDIIGWCQWVVKFQLGIIHPERLAEGYTPSNQFE